MAEKTIKRNIVIERAHWIRLAVIAANAGITRAQVLRLVIRGVCEAKDPSIYLPRRAAQWTAESGGVVPRETMPQTAEPESSEPEELPWATREDARQGMISCDLFRIPLDWIEWSTDVARTRAEAVAAGEGDDACLAYEPPRAAPSAH